MCRVLQSLPYVVNNTLWSVFSYDHTICYTYGPQCESDDTVINLGVTTLHFV